jgi:hypothetical protein
VRVLTLGLDSSVGTGWMVLDRIPVGGRDCTSSVQTGLGVHPASYIMGIGSFPGVKRPGRGIDHPPPPSAEVKERVDLYLYFPSGPVLG